VRRALIRTNAGRQRTDLELVPVARTQWVQWLLLLLLVWSAVAPGRAQSGRSVQGLVQSTNDQAQPNAVVYLQDQKSLEVKTYITEADGHYRFGQLSSDVDYQLWAEYKGHKSKTRSISSFDSKKQLNFDLKIDTSK
jgi:hypothetical protein